MNNEWMNEWTTNMKKIMECVLAEMKASHEQIMT
jgi:hypothetical protein